MSVTEQQLEEIAIAVYTGYSKHFSRNASSWKELRACVRNAFRSAAKSAIEEINRHLLADKGGGS